MSSTKYVLAVEELAYALGVLGGTDTAIGFLLAILGERPRMETEGRLLAASHALVARGLLDFDAETGEKWLDGGLKEVVEPMINNTYSLRCSKATKSNEDVITFFIGEDGLVKHSLLRSVVSVVERQPDWQSIINGLISFFELSHTEVQNDLIATGAADLMDSLRRDALLESANEAKAALMKYGASSTDADALLNDLQKSFYRGSIIKLGLKDEQSAANESMLLLKGTERSWLFVIESGKKPIVSIYTASVRIFTQKLEHLISA